MKKHYFAIILLLLSFTVNGQIKKQSIVLGGQLYYYNSKNKVDTFKSAYNASNISISAGKAYKENKIIGITIGFTPINQSNFFNYGDTTNLTYNRFTIGAFYREYKKLAKDFYFFTQVDAGFSTVNQTENLRSTSGNIKATQRGGSISLTPGVSYNIFKKMQLEITIPNIINFQYLVTKFNSQVPQVKSSTQEEFLFYSNFTNNTGLGFLGVGFRFIL